MADTTPRNGGGGLPPGNGNSITPIVGATVAHPTGFPAGTPVVSSLTHDNTVIPGRANAQATSLVLGVAAISGVVSGSGATASRVTVQYDGPLTLTTAQWDAVTGQTGGLTRGSQYFLVSGSEGHLSTTPPGGEGVFVVQVGIAMSPTDLLIQIQ